jgi:uncharacterized protein YbaR (Trm112 family)
MMGGTCPNPIGGGMAVTNAPTAAPCRRLPHRQLREGIRSCRQNGVTYRITNGVPVPVTGP